MSLQNNEQNILPQNAPDNAAESMMANQNSENTAGGGLNPVVRGESGDTKGTKKAYKTVKRKKHRVRRVLLIILCVLLALILAVGATGVIMYYKGKSYFKNFKINISAPDEAIIIKDDGSEVRYKDENYVYNDNIASILVLGVDRNSLEEEYNIGKNGQADAIYLVVLDTETKNASILGLSRDTIAEIDTYSLSGSYLGIEKQQICLAYSYGNGKETSCENMKSAVARVLYNIPIHSYVTVDMDAIPKITDVVGGVKVPEYGEDLMTKTGNEINLNSSNALSYIRERSHATAEANNARMERQRYYIDAFSKKFIARTKSDLTTPISVYNSLNKYDYMVTDVTASQVTYLAKNFLSGIGSVKMLNVPGEARLSEPDDHGKTYAEYYVDNEALYDIILDLFYVKG